MLIEKKELGQEEPYRWVCLAVYLIACLLNAVPSGTFAPISLEIAKLYGVRQSLVALNSTLYSLMHPLSVLFVNHVYIHKGLRAGIVLGSALNIAGVLLRLLIGVDYWFAVLGSAVAAVGHVFIVSAPLKFAVTWFRSERTTLVLAISLQLLMGSSAIGGFLPVLFVDSDSSKDDVMTLLYFTAGLITVGYSLNILLFRDQPTHPPNFSVQRKEATLREELSQLVRNRDYLLTCGSVCFVFGVASCFWVVLQFLISPFGFQPYDVGTIFLAAYFCGLANSTFVGVKLSKNRRLKTTLLFCGLIGTLAIGTILPALETRQLLPVVVLAGIAGAALFPFINTSSEYAAELAFPVSEGTSSSLTLMGGQITAFLLSMGLAEFLDKSKERSQWSCGLITLMLCLGLLVIALTREELRKSKFQQQCREEAGSPGAERLSLQCEQD